MSEAEWEHLTKPLDDASFWSLPTIDRNEVRVVDGADWAVEGRQHDVYHDVDRSWPTGRFLEACTYFLQLAGRKEDYKGYWPDVE